VTTSAELEAIIEANPDDVDAYHVYSDWLQSQGDPRGEWIALQAAAHRDPDDKKLEQRAGRYFDKHADALLGSLHEKHREDLALTWRHGFVRDARLGASSDEVFALLRELLAHPSSRFLQSITFVRGHDVDAIVDVLLAERRPATLAELRLVNLEDEHVEKLRAVFPRLHRSLDIEWRTLLGEIAAQRKLEIRFDAARLPPLEPNDPAMREIPVDRILLGLRLELDKQRGPAVVPVLRRTFTADSLDRFVLALCQQHVERGGTTTTWAWRAVGQLGGRRCATWIGESIVGWQMRALHAISVLGEINSDHAVLELAAIVSSPGHDREQRMQASIALGTAARRHGTDVEDLLDRSIPADPGPRGKAILVRRLQTQMIEGRRITRPTFRHHVASHPVIAPLAERIVWAIYDGRSVRTTFRPDGGRAVDVDGQPVELDGAIGILHPAELPADRRAAILRGWRDVFEAKKIAPLLPQLDRTVHTLAETEQGSQLDRFADRKIGLDRLRAVLEHQRGWEPAMAADYRMIDGWQRKCVRDSAMVTAYSDRTSITHVRAFTLDGLTPLAFAGLHPVTVCELLDDLETATTDKPTAAVADGPIGKGTRVQIIRGGHRGKHGVVFWLDGEPATRCGVRGDDGETYWADLAMVIVEGTAEPTDSGEPVFDRGARVHWRKGKTSGTGTVFWTGKNKFGDGMRVGIKDDANGETVWAAAKDCAPEEA
jgi:uncharacterized protein (TIGR02996 family)